MSGGGTERGRETQNLKQASGSELSAQSPTRARTHKSQDHDLSRSWTLNGLSNPGAPQATNLNEVVRLCDLETKP